MPDPKDGWDLKEWAKKNLPYGFAVAYLFVDFPSAPEVLSKSTHSLFFGAKAVGLLAGAVVGHIFAGGGLQRHRKSRSRSDGNRSVLQRAGDIAAVLVLSIAILIVGAWYYDLREDAENHFDLVLGVFFVLNIAIGMLIFWVKPAIEQFRGPLEPGENKEDKD